ncbi:hypothetical protein [Bradyrhizobium sp.]|nr:hypothetical protein [Bradyrhizobium sp.]
MKGGAETEHGGDVWKNQDGGRFGAFADIDTAWERGLINPIFVG